MSGVNPQGVQVTSFKAPGPQDLDHDFLWRINQALPERGRIGIFNRSHYEEVPGSCACIPKSSNPEAAAGTSRQEDLGSSERVNDYDTARVEV
jgi:Polyphosphate kinase 2 (PPK2)